MNIDRQFQAADVAVDRAVERFLSEVGKMQGRWEGVAAAYILERTLLALSDGLPKLIDDPAMAAISSPAALKLSNALLDYRDSLWAERG
jgi:hypothetical protein